ncbi:MAG: hypothetical protein NTU60_05605 [Candidatus Aminicenantes bacterium]|nr:hypothetical protein [Candidatus Aminicenantes bacterium]
MNPHLKRKLIAFIALAAAVVFCGGLWAQDKPVDPIKLYQEIAGDYEFQMDAQSLIVNFFEKDGKLFGAPPGETPEEIVPVKDSPLKFEVVISGSGQLYQLEFVRNENKVIDRCIMRAGGMEIVGAKIKK